METDSTSDKSIFVEFIGDTPTIRLFDFLITGRDFDYTLTDLAAKAGVSWSTLHRIFPQFIAHQVVREVRTVGRAKLYTLNASNLLVQKMIDLYDTLLSQELQKAAEVGPIPA